jgi:hypothetical protein
VVGDAGRRPDRGLVTGDEDVVLRRDEVGLDVVGAEPRAYAVGGERVLLAQAGGAAVAVDSGAPRRSGDQPVILSETATIRAVVDA